jgi:hypothetical protein
MKLQEKQIIKKSIKHVNRAIKNRRTKPEKKIKLNKMPKDEIEKNPNFKKIQKANKQ